MLRATEIKYRARAQGKVRHPMLPEEERRDRAIVNDTVRAAVPLRPVGSVDQYGVPIATE